MADGTSPTVSLPAGYSLESGAAPSGLPAGYTTEPSVSEQERLARPDLYPPSGVSAPKVDMQQVSPITGAPATNYQATQQEQTPEGHLAAVRQREAAEPQALVGIAKGAGAGIEESIGRRLPGEGPTTEELSPTNISQQIGHTIGYAGETLTEFLAGDAALKALPLAEQLSHVSSVMKIFQKSPRIMRAVQSGADLAKLETYLNPNELEFLTKSPVIRRLVTQGIEAVRLGTVQAAQTGVRTGDVKEAAKAGGEMAGTSAVLGGVAGVAGGLLEKGGKAAKTVETLGKVAEAAPTEPEVTGAAQSAVEAAKKQMHSAYDTGIKDIAGRLEGETAQLEGSPLQSKAKELLKTTAEHPEGLTKELRESLQGVVPGTERGQKMLKTLAGVKEEAGKAPSFVEKEFGGVAEEIKPPEDLSIKNLIKYRENLGKVARDLPHDDPNIKTVYGLLDGVDDTIEKMAKESGDTKLASDYADLRSAYKEKVKFFQPSNKPADQLAYNTVKILRSGTKDDIGKYLLSGGNVRAKVNSVKELLGPEATQNLGKDIFSTMVKESSKTEGRVNPANLIKAWGKIPNEVKIDLFDTKIEDAAIQELAKDTKSAAQIQHLMRLGLVGGIGATGAGSIGHVWIGTLLGLTIGEVAHGGVEAARNMLDYVTTHPTVWKSLGVASKVVEKAAPITRAVAPAVKQQVGQTVQGKPNLTDVYGGAERPLSEPIQKEQGVYTNQ